MNQAQYIYLESEIHDAIFNNHEPPIERMLDQFVLRTRGRGLVTLLVKAIS